MLRRFGAAGTPQGEMVRHGIKAAAAQRLTARQPPQGQRATTQRSEARHGDPRVVGTAWMKAAACAQQRAQDSLVDRKQKEYQLRHWTGRGARPQAANGRSLQRLPLWGN